MYYVISPFSGWEENFDNRESAIERANQIISNDEEGVVSELGYKSPDKLIDERWDSSEEMYESLSE